MRVALVIVYYERVVHIICEYVDSWPTIEWEQVRALKSLITRLSTTTPMAVILLVVMCISTRKETRSG